MLSGPPKRKSRTVSAAHPLYESIVAVFQRDFAVPNATDPVGPPRGAAGTLGPGQDLYSYTITVTAALRASPPGLHYRLRDCGATSASQIMSAYAS